MEFTASNTDLARVLSRAAAIASNKSSIASFTCVLLDVADGVLTARATDAFLSVESSAKVDVKKSGCIAVPASKVSAIVKALPVGEVRFKSVKTQVEISSGRSKSKIAFIPAEDFPTMPSMGDAAELATVKGSELARAIAQGSYAMYADDSKVELHATLFEAYGDSLRVVSTDGKRMAIGECAFEGKPPKMLLPPRALSEVRKLCESQKDGPISFAHVNGVAFFVVDGVTLSAKTVDSPYPPYASLIPEKCKHVVNLNRELFSAAVKRVSIVSGKDENEVRLIFSDGSLRITNASKTEGESEDVLDCDATFDEEIAVSPLFLVDALDAIRDDDVKFGINGSTGRIFVDSDEAKAVVMPRRKG